MRDACLIPWRPLAREWSCEGTHYVISESGDLVDDLIGVPVERQMGASQLTVAIEEDL